MLRRTKPLSRCGEHGFSAVELVLAVAATLIVTALGLSMYRTFLVRSQIATALEEAAPSQRLVVEAFDAHEIPPSDAKATGIDETAKPLLLGTYVDGIDVHNGRIDLRFGATADSAITGKILSLTPFETASREVVWLCGNAHPDVGLHPLGFAAGAPQPVHGGTSIEDRYLPPSCR